MSVAFNGVVLVAPGVASYIDDSTSSASPVSSGNALAILGEAERGETSRAVLFTDPATMRAYYGNASTDSPLVWGITRAMNAGALRVYGVRVGNATQASTTLVASGDSTSAITVNADEWGLTGNSWSLAVSKNGANPKNKDLKLTLHDGRIYTASNIGQNVLQIEYFTGSSTITPTIAIGTSGSVTNLYLTVNGNASQTAVIPLTDYDTISKLISKINQYFTQATAAIAGTPQVAAGSGGALPVSTLQRVGVVEATGQLALTLVDNSDTYPETVTVNYSNITTLSDFAANIQTALRAASPVGAIATTSATVTYTQASGFSFATGSTAKFSAISAINGAALPTSAQLNAGQGGSSVTNTLLEKCFPRFVVETFPHVAVNGGVAIGTTLESAGNFVSTGITAAIKKTVPNSAASTTWNPATGSDPVYTAIATGGATLAWTGTLTSSGGATMTFAVGDVITATHSGAGSVTLTVTTAVAAAASVNISYAGASSLASGTLLYTSIVVARTKQVVLPYAPTFSGDTFGGTAANSVVTKWNTALGSVVNTVWGSVGLGTGIITVAYAPSSGYTFTSTYDSSVVFSVASGPDIARFGFSAISNSSFPVASSAAIAVGTTTAATYTGNMVNTALIPASEGTAAQAANGWKASLSSGITDTTLESMKLDRLETTYVPTTSQISSNYASFIGYMADELVSSVLTPTLTVTLVAEGTVAVGQVIVGDGVISGTTIVAFQSTTTTAGVTTSKYTLSVSNTSGSVSDKKSYTATSAALSKLNLTANTNAIVDALNGPLLGALVTATATASAASILDKTYIFTGATEAAASPLHWDNALASLQSLDDVEIIVPMTPSSSIQSSVLSHCLSMSSAIGKRERFMVVGGDKNLSVEAAKSLASKFADKRAVVVWPGIKDYDDKNQLLTWSPVYLAATIGGMLAAQADVAQPLTAKPVSVRGLETTARLSDLDDLVTNGVLAIRYDSNRGYTITQSLTTWTGDTRYARREISTMRAADATMKLIRSSIQGFIGTKLSDRALDQVKNRVSQALAQANNLGLIVGTPSNPAFKDLIVRSVGDAIYVDVSISPAIPINYLLITAHLL